MVKKKADHVMIKVTQLHQQLVTKFEIDSNIARQIDNLQQTYHNINAVWKNPAKSQLKRKLQSIFLTKTEFPPLFCSNLSQADIKTANENKLQDWLTHAAMLGNIALVKWLYDSTQTNKQITLNRNTFLAANYSGNLELVQWLYEKINKKELLALSQFDLNRAAQSGCLKLVQWLCDKAPEEIRLIPNEETLSEAARSGNLPLVQWLCIEKQLIPNQDTLCRAVNSGNVMLMQWLCNEKHLFPEQYMLNWAARSGHFNAVLWLCNKTRRKNQLIPNQATLLKAIESGNLPLVQWLYKQKQFSPEQTILKQAVLSGNLSLMQWLCSEKYTNGQLRPDQYILGLAAELGYTRIYSFLCEHHEKTVKSAKEPTRNVGQSIALHPTSILNTNPRNDPKSPTHVNSISYQTPIGTSWLFKGYLCNVEKIPIVQCTAVSNDVKLKARQQIRTAVAKTLNDYNTIWQYAGNTKKIRSSYRALASIQLNINNLEEMVKSIIRFFKSKKGHWYAGEKNLASKKYRKNRGPSIKTLLMINLLTIPLFHRNVTNNILTLITRELDHGLQYELDLTKHKLGGCNIEGLICFFENECKRFAGLRYSDEEEEKPQQTVI